MARLELWVALLLLTFQWSEVKSDGLIQLLDELIQTEALARSGQYSEPLLQYDPVSSAQYTGSEAVSTSYGQSELGYENPALVTNGEMSVNQGIAKEGYGYMPPQIYDTSYQQQQPMYGYQLQPSYSYQPQPTYGYGEQQQQQQMTYNDQETKVKVKVKKIYIPVVMKKKKKKKMKIISVQKGFFIPGGTQLYGKYKSLYACEKACAATPNCFAGDYNPWFKKCYIHSNYTACGTLNAHKKLIHFKKVPCVFPEAPSGRVMLGTQIFGGIEQKKVKSLSDCLKCCASLGNGIPATSNDLIKQLCFGIDYDFGTHKCYFHVDNNYPPFHYCPKDGTPPPVPRDTVANPSVISILLCPGPFVPP